MRSFNKVIAAIIVFVMVSAMLPAVSFASEDTYLLRDLNKGGSTQVRLADYQTKETEHFVIIYDTDGANTITDSQLNELELVLENCWDLFIVKMGMEPTSTSIFKNGDKTTQYKTNVVIMGTGVDHYYLGAGEWGAYGGVDSAGYPYFMCSVTAVTAPTVVAHEFGHAVHYAQGDNAWENNIYLGPWFEAVANWFAEQYIYEYMDANTTQMSHLYLRANHLTKMNGRGYYEAWPILQYLTEDLDNTGVYGKTFVQKLLGYNSGKLDTLFWEVLEECNGDLTVADTVGMYASHMASLDFANESRYNKAIENAYNYSVFYWQQRFTMLEKLGEEGNTYAVPSEKAPQAMGYNITPIEFAPGEVSVELNALTDAAGADWRARLINEKAYGGVEYSELFSDGETASISAEENDKLYLSVAATPDISTMARHTITGWAEHSHESNMPYEKKTIYPYSVTITGGNPMERPRPSGMYRVHPNGGGRVAFTASVADTAYVGKNAVVAGYAQVSDNAVIDGYAIVGGNARVSGNAYVGDYAVMFDRAQATDNARVVENACLYVDYKVSGDAVVKGSSLGLYNGGATGEAVTYGDWFEDGGKVVSGGSFSGYNVLSYDNTWTNSRYAPLILDGCYMREYSENLRGRYEFNGNLRDTVAYSDLYSVGNVKTEEKTAVFNGGYIQLNESALCYDRLGLEMSVKGEGEILSLGGKIKLYTENDKALLSVGDKIITGTSYSTDEFNDIAVVIADGKAVLRLNGTENTADVSITALEAMREGGSYLGRGFVGEIDYLRIYDDEKQQGRREEFFNTTLSEEAGELNTKTEDEKSIWYNWEATAGSGVTVDDGLNFQGALNSSVTARGYITGKFTVEFAPYGGKAYPDHGVIDLDGEVLFAYRYASDANSIHAGRGEINTAIRGASSIKDTTGQDRLTNFVCEKLYSASQRTDRGSIAWKSGDRVAITAKNTLWSEELAERFEKSENNTVNKKALDYGDSVYIVTYALVRDGIEFTASESVYTGHFEGFGGFKTAGGAAGIAVGYKDMVLYGDNVMYKCKARVTLSEDGDRINVLLENAKEGTLIILALYDGDALKGVQSKKYTGESLAFEPLAEYTRAKVMLWSGYDKMKVVGEAKTVK